MNFNYRDNYPHNIEAPQRVYIQYSQDIDFDYSTGKYPLGETYEGFYWETEYMPVEHVLNNVTYGRHVWMRWRIGTQDDWTKPMRLTDSFVNIKLIQGHIDESTGDVSFTLEFTLANGDIITSEEFILKNGLDGRGIINATISDYNLILNFTDGTSQDVGRVVGYDGYGFPSSGSTIPGNIAIVDSNGDIIWTSISDILNNNLSAILPIEYSNTVFSHSDLDGYRHIPVGGSNGDVLTTDGAGNYTWFSLGGASGYIPWTAIDDTAGAGDIYSLYSADKISSLIAGLSAFGIKYSVDLYTDLATIPTPTEGELAVVTADPLYPNRPVYRYESSVWTSFFDLDADHNHDDRYYTKTEMTTPGSGITIDWSNITSVPTFSSDWYVTDGTTTSTISSLDTLTFAEGPGASLELVGNTLTISATGTSLLAGDGINIVTDTISHEDTSSIANTTNLNGVVVQNLTFDNFGHVLSSNSLNLDGRFYTKGYVDSNFYTQSDIDSNFYTKTEVNDGFVAVDGGGNLNLTGNLYIDGVQVVGPRIPETTISNGGWASRSTLPVIADLGSAVFYMGIMDGAINYILNALNTHGLVANTSTAPN